jgi:hypothetical protein
MLSQADNELLFSRSWPAHQRLIRRNRIQRNELQQTLRLDATGEGRDLGDVLPELIAHHHLASLLRRSSTEARGSHSASAVMEESRPASGTRRDRNAIVAQLLLEYRDRRRGIALLALGDRDGGVGIDHQTSPRIAAHRESCDE